MSHAPAIARTLGPCAGGAMATRSVPLQGSRGRGGRRTEWSKGYALPLPADYWHMTVPFDQQAKESVKAFEAFSVYLGMGSERSLAAVAQKLAKSEQLLKRWSARFDWPGRVAAHEAHLAGVEREAAEALARGRAAEWLKRQETLRETE